MFCDQHVETGSIGGVLMKQILAVVFWLSVVGIATAQTIGGGIFQQLGTTSANALLSQNGVAILAQNGSSILVQ